MFTTAVVPEINTIGVVGAIVVALAIVGAAALTALKPLNARLVPVAAPITGAVNTMPLLVQALILPLATVPNTGAVNTMPVLVQALMLPLATVPNAGATSVALVNSNALVTCLVVPDCTIGKTSVVAAAVAAGREVIAMVAMLVVSCVNVKTLTGGD
jgi:hypothetical protein